MFSKHKIKIYIIVAIIICVGSLFVWYLRMPEPLPPAVETVQIGTAKIRAELATTTAQQMLGLSGRKYLAANTGMLFVFDYPSKWGIWMKDMNFPIDVLWITDDLKVVDIVENMTPASYPHSYVPKIPAQYVLEVPVGTVKQYGIVVGQSVVLK